MNSFYSERELEELGVREVGKNVLISRKCSIYGAENIRIGNNSRIDDFVILSGKICIGDYVHISAGTYLFGGEAGIEVNDFIAVSAHCCIYAVTDDYLGFGMTNPMIPEEYRKVTQEKVTLEKHVIIGAGSVVLPGVHIAEGGAFGSMSLINKSTKEWKVYMGVPIKEWKERKKLTEMEAMFRKQDARWGSVFENGSM